MRILTVCARGEDCQQLSAGPMRRSREAQVHPTETGAVPSNSMSRT